MKQQIRFISIVLSVMIAFVACENNTHGNQTDATQTKTDSVTTVVTAETSNSVLETPYDTETLYLIENSSVNVISVAIPDLNHDLNLLVYNYVYEYLEKLTGREFNLSSNKTNIDLRNLSYTDYYIDVGYKITFYDESLISITFDGFLNYKSAAHPINLFFTVNIDTDNAKRIYFKDLYLIDSELYSTFYVYAIEELSQKNVENAESIFGKLCPYDSFIKGMDLEQEFFVYYTSNGVGISYPVPHAGGDHWEVEIPYSEIERTSTQ